MKKAVFEIKGMHCNSCAMNIDLDLEELEGVAQASTNYAHSRLTVEYDPTKVTPEQILASVKKTGYEASLSDKSQ